MHLTETRKHSNAELSYVKEHKASPRSIRADPECCHRSTFSRVSSASNEFPLMPELPLKSRKEIFDFGKALKKNHP